tara:strand:- start:477 stop:776 length:300 start_codon:yes stop_codon:yes gene_type:complete
MSIKVDKIELLEWILESPIAHIIYNHIKGNTDKLAYYQSTEYYEECARIKKMLDMDIIDYSNVIAPDFEVEPSDVYDSLILLYNNTLTDSINKLLGKSQ